MTTPLAKIAAAPLFALLLSACSGGTEGASAAITLPPASDARAQGAALASACEGRDGWGDAAPPARIHGSTYYVGTCGIAVLLIAGEDGHILIDAAVDEAVPSILANITALGFDPRDIRHILYTHEHYDHMGGLAAMAQATGANVWSAPVAKDVLEAGTVDAGDPQFGLIDGAPPVRVTHTFAPGHVIAAGNVAVTAVPTPGHTAGGTSWTWESCEGGECATFAYVDSLSAVSRDGYRFTDNPQRVAPFRTTFATVAQMPCDIMVTPHPSFSNLFDRLAGREPLMNNAACRDLSALMAARLDTRLAQEAAQ
ncbi:subclass B3 metallo-beta-lactamase [Alteraurantiacibacter palmitatis]|uniref:Subclass B3 metallo-beta-lactamase n=1 Tax=Alteraurantiacibacter palmitatis TaxID=2054628 RepID=A0ABV7E522_9SPHN